MLRLIHTSDWHLGHTLHGQSRDAEHRAFLAFLLETLAAEAADALVVTGDVFDTSNPPAAAQALYYRFLAEARRRVPGLQIVVIAGNHDSAARIAAPGPVLREMGVHVIGAVPRVGVGPRAPLDLERMLVPLSAEGEVRAWLAAVPFLRMSDVSAGESLEAGMEEVYRLALDAARARLEPGQALLATGHLHLASAAVSEDSERRVMGGQTAVSDALFPADVAYAALGHLHLPQAVGRETVRYAGSPIPLSMTEAGYRHEVRLVTLDGPAVVEQKSVAVPRAVPVLRVPGDGPGELEDVLGKLAALEVPSSPLAPAFVDVRVRLREPVPDLRARVEAALGEREVRLVRIATTYAKDDAEAEAPPPARQLSDLTLEEVFRRCWADRFEGEPPAPLVQAFHEVVEAATREPEPASAPPAEVREERAR